MEQFAKVSDLEARWRPLKVGETVRADALLSDSSSMLMALMSRSGVKVDGSDDVQANNLKSVSCSMVQRAMSVGENMAGVTQYSQTAGPFNGSTTFANPNADLYVTSGEKKRLGIGRSRVGSVRPAIHDCAGDLIAGW